MCTVGAQLPITNIDIPSNTHTKKETCNLVKKKKILLMVDDSSSVTS